MSHGIDARRRMSSLFGTLRATVSYMLVPLRRGGNSLLLTLLSLQLNPKDVPRFMWKQVVVTVKGLIAFTGKRVLIEGLRFGEGARWRKGKLYMVDMHEGEVLAVGTDGSREVVAKMPSRCSGLGWLPDGTMLVVSMEERAVMSIGADGAKPQVWADLSGLATWHCNDMLVDPKGRAYVGNFGWDIYDPARQPAAMHIKPSTLVLATEGKPPRAAVEGLAFPNGTVQTPDGKTLIVAETFASCLTAFEIDPSDGSLSNRRVWAQLPCPPDGICLDAEGCVWVANPMPPGYCVRVAEGGAIKQVVFSSMGVFACTLGGDDGKSLFMLEADESDPDKTQKGNAQVSVVQVAVGASVPASP